MNPWISKLAHLMSHLLGMSTCREATEGITEMSEGAMSEADRVRVEKHVRRCGACQAYRAQMDVGMRALKELPRQELAETEKDDLMRRFRERQERRVR
jgi:anti-sigma factor RsiW